MRGGPRTGAATAHLLTTLRRALRARAPPPPTHTRRERTCTTRARTRRPTRGTASPCTWWRARPGTPGPRRTGRTARRPRPGCRCTTRPCGDLGIFLALSCCCTPSTQPVRSSSGHSATVQSCDHQGVGALHVAPQRPHTERSRAQHTPDAPPAQSEQHCRPCLARPCAAPAQRPVRHGVGLLRPPRGAAQEASTRTNSDRSACDRHTATVPSTCPQREPQGRPS